jgi:predicted Zn-dependent protease with MMP-like domain
VIVEIGVVGVKGKSARQEARGGPVPCGPMPAVRVTREHFEALVADALDSIPPELGEQMDNVVVLVEDYASPRQQREYGGMLLGVYEGVELTRRGPISYDLAVPDRITIFQRPLEQMSRDLADLAERVRVTVLHEVGHHFGLSDERLEELGWA